MVSALIVDDSNFLRNILIKKLTQLGVNVVGEAKNGIEALVKFNQTQPDIVFLDITMEGMNGIDILKKIKNNNQEAKVIMCSAMGQQSYVREAIQNGANDFIVKPFTDKTLREVLYNVLKSI